MEASAPKTTLNGLAAFSKDSLCFSGYSDYTLADALVKH